MKQDVLLCGVGGQGILSMAYVIDYSAMEAGYSLKQPEVHGMSQRGGAVQAHIRVSDGPIASELIPLGQAELILSLEPLESLRYLQYLAAENGCVITDITPFVNIPNYPELSSIYGQLFQLPSVLLVNGAHLARKAGSPKAQNMILLGAASTRLPYPVNVLEKHVAELFARKSERLVHVNMNAFRTGCAVSQLHQALRQAGVADALISRVLPWLDFEPWPVPEPVVRAWIEFFRDPAACAATEGLWRSQLILPLEEEAPRKLREGA
ncbi:MAG: indolepyruvate oxidoreductase subunit beta [Acidobacteria bacterium]|nr:MAG: indolepyruvate oxidoreductase subunit beta [Acidobacteriota bacterium]